MSRSLNLSLTEELRAFVDANSGEGTLFATPSEFVRALLRAEKNRLDAARFRRLVLEGYEDLAHGRVVEFRGNLDSMVAEAQERYGDVDR